MTESLWWIKQCELFRRLAPGELQRLEQHSRCRSFPAKSPLILPSDGAESVFLLTEGLAKLSHLTGDGRESILAFIEPGELFGELALFDDRKPEEYVETVERCTVVAMPAEEVRRLVNEHADLAVGVTRLVGLRRQRIERRLRNLLFRSNRERLIHLLLDLSEQFGVQTNDGVQLRVRLSHQDIASLIGSTRESVTVLLGELKSAGEIGGGRRRVVLTKPCQLAKSVGRKEVRLASGKPPDRNSALACLEPVTRP
ncbi:MAG: Crp/Fnr family transcriptional regulator [Planctomycetales bacterium]|nr:Crp/Fnr family transcriptional regulator [Planctomycetales bacterium]